MELLPSPKGWTNDPGLITYGIIPDSYGPSFQGSWRVAERTPYDLNTSLRWGKSQLFLVDPAGLEPATHALKGRYSTN